MPASRPATGPPAADPVPDPGPASARLLRAAARVPGEDGATGHALRTGVLRRQHVGHITGLCAALADAWGAPPRLVRLAALGLLLLGVGLPLYLIASLVLPRESEATPDTEAVIDRPVVSLLRGRPARGDLLIALSVIPALVIAWLWARAFVFGDPAPLRLVIPIEAAVLLVLAWSAVRARNARTAFLMAQLAARAGIVDDAELTATLARLRRDAPWAWGTRPGETAGFGANGDERPRARSVSRRQSIVLMGALLGLSALAFLVVSVRPGLAPGLATTTQLPVAGRLGSAAGVTTVFAGVILILLGVGGRRSLLVAGTGFLAFVLFASSVAWVRATAPNPGNPIIYSVDSYVPGLIADCEDVGRWNWGRPVVIDLTHLTALQARESMSEAAEELDPQWEDLSMGVACNRTVGDLTVWLPPEDSGLVVRGGLTTALGTVHGAIPDSTSGAGVAVPAIDLRGRLGTGNLRYVQPPS